MGKIFCLETLDPKVCEVRFSLPCVHSSVKYDSLWPTSDLRKGVALLIQGLMELI